MQELFHESVYGMKTKFSRFSKYLEGESRFYLEYRKTHPHMWICLGSEALLIVVMAIGWFAITDAISPKIDSTLLGRSGVTYMSARELTKHVEERQIDAFWLGANTSYEYSIICNQPNVEIIILYPRDINGKPIPTRKIVIETYGNLKASMAIHPIIDEETVLIDLPQVGRQIEYDTSRRTEVRVTFNGQSKVVHLHYSTSQPEATMVENATVLQLIQ